MAERETSSFDLEARQADASASRLWWFSLVRGVLWILFALIVLRFEDTTVASISIPFLNVTLAAGAKTAGYFDRSAVLLVVWRGSFASVRGVTEIMLGSNLRPAAGEAGSRAGAGGFGR